MNRGTFTELFLLLLAAFCVFAVAVYLDLHERFEAWADRYEEWHIDEVLLLALLLVSALFIFTWRRWKESNAEVAQRRILQKELEHRATHDSLTDLPNRILLMDRIKHALARTSREKECAAVLLLDLDEFKEVNDAFGHESGDKVLKEVANRLREHRRPTDTVSRLGGDEFVVVVEGIKDTSEVARVAERLLNVLGEPVELDDREAPISASVGVALGAYPEDDPEDLLRKADAMMYQAKRAGKTTYKVV